MQNQTVTPTHAYFKEGEVYVYTLLEKVYPLCDEILAKGAKTKCDNQAIVEGKCYCQKYKEACTYAREHPFEVHEKDKEKIGWLIFEAHINSGCYKNHKEIHDEYHNWTPQDLTEYRIENLSFEIELDCKEPKTCYSDGSCTDCPKVACLIEHKKGVKEINTDIGVIQKEAISFATHQHNEYVCKMKHLNSFLDSQTKEDKENWLKMDKERMMKQSPSEEGKEIMGIIASTKEEATEILLAYKNEELKNKIIKDILNKVYGERTSVKDIITDLEVWMINYLEPYSIAEYRGQELEKGDQEEVIKEFITEFNSASGGWRGGMNAVKSKFIITRRD